MKLFQKLLISSVAATFSVGNESAAGANDGQIDLIVSGGTPCSTNDTLIPGVHFSNFTSTSTRGYYFQAQSSFTVSGLMCPDDAAPGVARPPPGVALPRRPHPRTWPAASAPSP